MGKINYKEFSIIKEMFLLFKLNIKKKFHKKIKREGKILLVNSALAGDTIVTFPAISNFLKLRKIKVDMIVTPNIKSLAERIKGVEKVFASNSIYSKTEKQNLKIPDDYKEIIFIRTGLRGYRILKNFKNYKLESSYPELLKLFGNILNSIIFNKKVNQWKDSVFDILKIENPREKMNLEEIFNFRKLDYKKIEKIKELKFRGKIVVINTGAGWSEKLWDDTKWIELLKKINPLGKFRFIFIGNSKQERESFEKIQKNLKFKIYSLIEKGLDLKDLFLIMKKSNYFIGIDSGPRNLAHLADLRSVTLIGPLVKTFMPFNKKDVIIETSGNRVIHLANLSKKNGMRKISSEKVFNGFKKILK